MRVRIMDTTGHPSLTKWKHMEVICNAGDPAMFDCGTYGGLLKHRFEAVAGGFVQVAHGCGREALQEYKVYEVAKVVGDYYELVGLGMAGWNKSRFHLVEGPAEDLVPDARRTDPETSKAAARAVAAKKPTIKGRILELLALYPAGLTGTEIACYSGYRLNSITPRFAELMRSEKIACASWQARPHTRSGEQVWVLR